MPRFGGRSAFRLKLQTEAPSAVVHARIVTKQTTMLKSKTTWVLLAVAFAASLVFVRLNFTKANSIVNIRITMDRNEALRQAAVLKERHAWGPASARSATVFELDGRLQTFVELEAGGKAAFTRLLKGSLLSPYTWRVRFFREGEVNETQMEFTPAGLPYGFRETLSENAPGVPLGEAEARALAEKAAREDWRVDLDAFQPVETSKEVRPGGRIDHILVYERRSETVGEGRYRLRLVVSGDRFTELSHFLKIPESFDRRYEQMRSANETIATSAAFVFYILYFGVGCLGGLFFLLRRRYLRWRVALSAGALVAVLGALGQINYLPIAWMQYSTAESAAAFVATLVAGVLMNVAMTTFLLGLTFMVAESLTRYAFPHMIQFWKVWRPAVAASPDVGGQTIIGFLMIGFLGAYDVAVYLLGNNWLGWWAPSDTLVDPNILSMYLPWLTPAAMALHAGFWEECLFRAVPLSCAALIGARFGRPRLIIGLALVAQAIIFGAAHANYPNQPAYARIVEIMPAFVVFGLVYLRFGLLPVIVAHFGVDMVYMSLPIFFTETDRIWVDRLIAILLFTVPLLVVAIALLVRRGWRPVPEGLLNRAWVPPATPPAEPARASAPAQPVRLFSARDAAIALSLGAAALAAWVFFSDFHRHFDRLTPTRVQAGAAGRQALSDRHLMPTGTWEVTTAVLDDQQAQAERYVWQERGSETYDRLQRMKHLSTPSWHVRLVRFDESIDVAERAEGFGVFLCGTGEIARVYHELPEGRAGVEMKQEEARDKTLAFLADGLRIDTSALKEVSTKPEKKPKRTDWSVTLAYTNLLAFTNREVEITVGLADGVVADCVRGFHTPEAWSRAEQARTAVFGIITLVCSLLVTILFIAGMIVGIVRWSRGRFAAAVFFRVFATFICLSILTFANGWPSHLAAFSTARPWLSQCLLLLVQQIIALLLVSPVAALLAGAAAGVVGESARTPRPKDLAVAGGIGLCAAAVLRAAALWTPEWHPEWPSCTAANSYLPLLQTPLGAITLFVLHVSFVAFVLWTLNRATARRGWWSRLCILLPLGIVLAGREEVRGVLPWLGTGVLLGALIGIVNEVALRNRLHLLPPAYAAWVSLGLLREAAFSGYTGALWANVLAIAAVLSMSWVFSRWLAGAARTPVADSRGNASVMRLL